MPGPDWAAIKSAGVVVEQVLVSLPYFDLRLTNGETAMLGGEVFAPISDALGVLGSVSTVGDGDTGQAWEGQITIYPRSATGFETLLDPEAQGSPVRIWTIYRDAVTGDALGDPDPIMAAGRLNTVRWRCGATEWSVTLSVVDSDQAALSGWEGVRLNASTHRALWPGEAGLDNADGVLRRTWWGGYPPPSAMRVGAGSGGVGQPLTPQTFDPVLL